MRSLYRIVISLLIIVLPKVHMNSLQLIATTTGLVISVLVLELVGSSCWGDNIVWENRCGRDKATYSAKCWVKREELEKSVKDGTVLDVEEIARRDGREKGGVSAV
jgi:hypothetical protein